MTSEREMITAIENRVMNAKEKRLFALDYRCN